LSGLSKSDQLMTTSLTRTAQLLADRFSAATGLKERHFEQFFEQALEETDGVSVLPGVRPNLAHWRKAAPIDTTAQLADGTRLAAELKWGAGTLYNCSWDLAKLAVVRGEAVADHAYLVAGAPAIEWETASASELFRAADWAPARLLTAYRKHFDFWAIDVPTTGPIDVPHAISVRAIGSVQVPGWSGDWSLRAARIDVGDVNWVPWPSLLDSSD